MKAICDFPDYSRKIMTISAPDLPLIRKNEWVVDVRYFNRFKY